MSYNLRMVRILLLILLGCKEDYVMRTTPRNETWTCHQDWCRFPYARVSSRILATAQTLHMPLIGRMVSSRRLQLLQVVCGVVQERKGCAVMIQAHRTTKDVSFCKLLAVKGKPLFQAPRLYLCRFPVGNSSLLYIILVFPSEKCTCNIDL